MNLKQQKTVYNFWIINDSLSLLYCEDHLTIFRKSQS